MKPNMPKKALLVLTVGIVFPVVIGVQAHVRAVRHTADILNRYRPAASVSIKPDLLELNTYDWVGGAVRPGKRLHAWLLTEDVWTEVRINQDNNQVYPHPPVNYPKSTNKPWGTVRYVEFRIRAGQKVTRAKMAYEFEAIPKKGK